MKLRNLFVVALFISFALPGLSHADEALPPFFPQINAASAPAAPISGTCLTADDTLHIVVTDTLSATATADLTCSGTTYSATLNTDTLVDGDLDADLVFGDDTTVSIVVHKDTVPPTITGVFVGGTDLGTSAESHEFATATPAFEIDSEDANMLTCSIDGAAAVECLLYAEQFQAAALSDGAHTLSIEAEDSFGNEMPEPFLVHFTVELGDSVHIKVMSGSDIAFDDDWELPAVDAPDVSVTPTDGNPAVLVDARSVLALLTAIDTANDSFVINDLQFSDFFDSFFLACITFSGDDPGCFWWQYTVTPSGDSNNLYAQVGMDKYVVDDGDAVYVFFRSDPLVQLELSDNEVEVGESFTVTAQTFNPATGIFGPAAGQILGAVQTDEFFNTTEFATSTANGAGTATLSVSTAGDYDVGMKEVGYYPTLALSVIEPVEESSGGGGGTTSTTTPQFSVPRALAYLSALQATDGSIANPLVSDWAALAFAASDPGIAKSKLRDYLPASSATPSSITDYERRAMALMALGINPYNGTSRDYITPIVNAFDGTQIGSASLVNDDVFAVFPLLRAGYSTSDIIIQKTAAFIVSKQLSNGSWENSVDFTAATVQALAELTSQPGVSDALTNAKSYLHTQQQTNGGFGNNFSTSWTLQAIAGFGESDSSWTVNGKTGLDLLATLQQADGGVDLTSVSAENRMWATTYAIPAALGKTWISLLSDFSKPTAPSVIPEVVATTTPAVATTTLAIASSTPPIATSTPLMFATAETAGEALCVAIR